MSGIANAAKPAVASPSYVPRGVSRPVSPLPLPPTPVTNMNTGHLGSAGHTSLAAVPMAPGVSRSASSSSLRATPVPTHHPLPNRPSPSLPSRPISPLPAYTPRMDDRRRNYSHLRNEVSLRDNRPADRASTPGVSGTRSSAGPSSNGAPRPSSSTAQSSSSTRGRQASDEREEGEVTEVSKAALEAAKLVLKALSSLPAPLPESLPRNFLPTPSASPEPQPPGGFVSYVHSRKRSRQSRSPDSADGSAGLGLGLGLNIGESAIGSITTPGKKRKLSTQPQALATPDLVRSASAPSLTRASDGSAQNGRDRRPRASDGVTSGSRRGSSDGLGDRGLWTPQQWSEAGKQYRDRALRLKRHADAYARDANYQRHLSHLPKDPLKGLLCLTDAALLWLYSYFCEEQCSGRVRTTPYNDSMELRRFIQARWEHVLRGDMATPPPADGSEPDERDAVEDQKKKDMARGMVGLMQLCEAVINYHLTTTHLQHLRHRSKELAAGAATAPTPPSAHASLHHASAHHGAGPSTSGHGHPHTTAHGPAGPSPRSNQSASPPNHGPSPASHSIHSSHSNQSFSTGAGGSGSGAGHGEAPSNARLAELLPYIDSSTHSFARASAALATSRQMLSHKLLRTCFPETYEHALDSDFGDATADTPTAAGATPGAEALGAARRVDIDKPERFVWPIELGMGAPIAHTAAFGRCLVREMALEMGRDWDMVLD